MDRRTRLIEIFRDTQKFYRENETLAEAIRYSKENTKLYAADDYPDLPGIGSGTGAESGAESAAQSSEAAEKAVLTMVDDKNDIAKAEVSTSKTFEAAVRLHREYPGKRIAVLNFASAVNPGGGVKGGSSAQEERLCRCSTLYPCLDRRWLWKEYYSVNRHENNRLNTDVCIYTPGVIICKTDEDYPERVGDGDFVTVDVITCAAPDLREAPLLWTNPATGRAVRMDPERLYQLHVKRARHILHVAAANRADILVLGAFGCGAFANDPDTVARAYRRALIPYRLRFDVVEFAIYCREHETENYEAFEGWFGE